MQQAHATGTQELAKSYALLGLLMDIEGGARAEVEAQIDYSVSVDIDVLVPEGASRTFRQLFERVRAARRADAPRLENEVTENACESVARVRSTPEGLVTEVQLACEGRRQRVRAPRSKRRAGLRSARLRSRGAQCPRPRPLSNDA